jgi:hypothetical protein
MSSDNTQDRLATLAWEISHCPYFEAYDHGQAGVCSEVIRAQGMFRRDPEGWTGRLIRAPILFVTSNPNTDPTQPGKDPEFASPAELANFNDLYFDTHSVARVQTWRQMQKWATEMLDGREALPGHDFALTDAVRCASRGQQGVDRAMGRCAGLYLGRLLFLSQARVVAFCGRSVVALRDFLEPERYRLTLRQGEVKGPIDFFERQRWLVGLKHPADVYHGNVELTTLTPVDLAALVAALT